MIYRPVEEVDMKHSRLVKNEIYSPEGHICWVRRAVKIQRRRQTLPHDVMPSNWGQVLHTNADPGYWDAFSGEVPILHFAGVQLCNKWEFDEDLPVADIALLQRSDNDGDEIWGNRNWLLVEERRELLVAFGSLADGTHQAREARWYSHLQIPCSLDHTMGAPKCLNCTGKHLLSCPNAFVACLGFRKGLGYSTLLHAYCFLSLLHWRLRSSASRRITTRVNKMLLALFVDAVNPTWADSL